jgi:hypothetical protein
VVISTAVLGFSYPLLIGLGPCRFQFAKVRLGHELAYSKSHGNVLQNTCACLSSQGKHDHDPCSNPPPQQQQQHGVVAGAVAMAKSAAEGEDVTDTMTAARAFANPQTITTMQGRAYTVMTHLGDPVMKPFLQVRVRGRGEGLQGRKDRKVGIALRNMDVQHSLPG